MAELKELIKKNRSYRRFFQDITVTEDTLRELVGLARLSPSASNLQPLRFMLSWQRERCDLIFPCLKWAADLPGWGGPSGNEMPSAYIVILGDKDVATAFGCDPGIAAQSILLGAVEKGLGGCIIGSVDRKKLRKALNIPDKYETVVVIALGKPSEKVCIERIGPDGKTNYWRDLESVHHVPKRSLEELIIN